MTTKRFGAGIYPLRRAKRRDGWYSPPGFYNPKAYGRLQAAWLQRRGVECRLGLPLFPRLDSVNNAARLDLKGNCLTRQSLDDCIYPSSQSQN